MCLEPTLARVGWLEVLRARLPKDIFPDRTRFLVVGNMQPFLAQSCAIQWLFSDLWWNIL